MSGLVSSTMASPRSNKPAACFKAPPSLAIFDIFIDGLLYRLNADTPDIPSCLFYADDGVILVRDLGEAQRLLNVAETWTREALLTFNVKKGAVITPQKSPLLLKGEPIPSVECYKYLGFPITPTRIDFVKHLNTRIGAAIKRSDFIAVPAVEVLICS
jgi:hypothetical protein